MISIDPVTMADKLRPMRALRLLPVVAALVAACGDSGGKQESRAAGNSADTSTARASTVPWFAGALPLLLVPAHSNDRALVIQADTLMPAPDEGRLDPDGKLFLLDGTALPVRVTVGSVAEACIDAALDPAPARGWGVGFVGGAARPIAVDSLAGIPRIDSVTLTRTVFRLASAVPNAPGGRFSGLPFTLVSLWRFAVAPGRTALVGVTRRQINQEDSPLEERTIVVAEADSGAEYSVAYSARSTGAEETVEGSELLAVLEWPASGEIDAVVSHDFGGQSAFSLLARDRAGAWKLRWTSRRLSC